MAFRWPCLCGSWRRGGSTLARSEGWEALQIDAASPHKGDDGEGDSNDAALHASNSSGLLGCADVPEYQTVPFILSGYRPTCKGPGSIVRTVFSLHNETGNMWTHLVGFAYFLVAGVRLCAELWVADELRTFEPVFLLLLVASSALSLMASFTYHLCLCGEKCVSERAHKIDLSGIALLISMTYITGVAVGYRCFPDLRRVYLAYATCVVCALVGPLMWPRLSSDLTRHFIVCCLFGLVPVVHFVCLAPWEDTLFSLPYVTLMFGCYAAGAAFYVSRWPERRWPSRFDLIGQSHQLWHVFVVVAAMSWVQGCAAFFRAWDEAHCEDLS